MAVSVAWAVVGPSHGAEVRKDAYLTDTHGEIVRTAGAKECVRTGQWAPALATSQCHADMTPDGYRPPPPVRKPLPAAPK